MEEEERKAIRPRPEPNTVSDIEGGGCMGFLMAIEIPLAIVLGSIGCLSVIAIAIKVLGA